MKVFIRCDSSLAIGSGHVVRCLNLAGYLKEMGCTIVFYCRPLEGNAIGLIQEKQFKVVLIQTRDEAEECGVISGIIQVEQPHLVIVDHYELSSKWETIVRNQRVRLVVFDDIGRAHNCDALLDQNLQPAIHAQYSTKCTLFLGPKYAILAPGFQTVRPHGQINKSVERVLLFFGGTDPARLTLKVAQWIKASSFDFITEMVVGNKNPDIEALKLLSLEEKFELHIQTREMPKIMSRVDLFIGAGGSVTWERCSLGLPGICTSVADNQVPLCEELSHLKSHSYLGPASSLTEEKLVSEIKRVMADVGERERYSQASLKLLVGSKLNTFVQAIMKLA